MKPAKDREDQIDKANRAQIEDSVENEEINVNPDSSTDKGSRSSVDAPQSRSREETADSAEQPSEQDQQTDDGRDVDLLGKLDTSDTPEEPGDTDAPQKVPQACVNDATLSKVAKEPDQADRPIQEDATSTGVSQQKTEPDKLDKLTDTEPAKEAQETITNGIADASGEQSQKVRSVESVQMSLLEHEAQEPKRKPTLHKAYLLTNRSNLLEILSSGLIKPVSGYGKYYKDMGALCPESVILLGRPPSARLLERVMEDADSQLPVVLSIDVACLVGGVTTVNSDFDVTEEQLPVSRDSLAILIKGAIPQSLIKGVHFRTEEEHLEFTVREYRNVPVDRVSRIISPGLFSGPEVNTDDLFSALESVCNQAILEQGIWKTANALAGAMLMLSTATRSGPSISIQALAHCLNAFGSHTIPQDTPSTSAMEATVFRWMELLPELLLSNQANRASTFLERLQDEILKERDRCREEDRVIDALVFFAAIDYLVNIAPPELSHIDMLESIDTTVEHLLTKSKVDDSQRLIRDTRQKLDAISSVVNLTTDIEAFREPENDVSVGLLQFLLHSDPHDSLHLDLDVQNPPESAAITAVFSGMLYGRNRIPLDCRPRPELESYIDGSTSRMICDRLNGPQFKESVLKSAISVVTDEEGAVEYLLADDVLLMERDITADDCTTNHPVTAIKDEKSEVGVELPLSERVREHLINSRLSDDRDRDAAILLCREAGWEDCLTTVMPLDRRVFLLTNHTGRFQIRIRGDWCHQIELEVRKTDFDRHLSQSEWRRLPQHLIRDVASLLNLI